ncbi:hypothetical protein RB195_018743 [Necator americanus]|uniref:Uncharacterized protein n=1 Tax=Necator americanus TaxID=51031 RepID=A0ABR1CDV9_NECAM
MSAGHSSTSSSHDLIDSEVEQGLAVVPCLTPVTTSNGFLSGWCSNCSGRSLIHVIRQVNELSWYPVSAERVEKAGSMGKAENGFKVQKR